MEGLDISSRRVLVYGLQRSGTTWIASIIDHVDGARCSEEVFLETPVLPGSYLAEAPRMYSWSRRVLRPVQSRVDFLARVLSPTAQSPIVGAKLMYSQIGWPIRISERFTRRWPVLVPLFSMKAVRRWIIANDVTVIVVERRNVLKLRVSELIAQQTGIMHSTEGQRSIEGIAIETAGLVTKLERIERRQLASRRFLAGCQTVDIAYEDGEDSKSDALSRALAVELPSQLKSRYEKVTADDLRVSILNFEEVAAVLRGTRFEWCLEA